MHTKLIPLTRGLWTLVDAADYDRLRPFKWRAIGRQNNPYAARGVGGVSAYPLVYLHRAVTGAPAGMEVDHRNGDPLDNRRSNLRICPHVSNVQNRPGYKNTSSQYCGVAWDRQTSRWRASIAADSKHYQLGRFDTPEEAARAYDAAAMRLHGEFARLNFPT